MRWALLGVVLGIAVIALAALRGDPPEPAAEVPRATRFTVPPDAGQPDDPVPGVLVVHVLDLETKRGLAGAWVSGTRTDETGAARLTAHGNDIAVELDGYEPFHARLERGAGETHVTVELSRGAPVSGIALDPMGAPIADEIITIEGGPTPGKVLTDAHGNWRTKPLRAGRYTVRVGGGLPTELELDGEQPMPGVVVNGSGPARVEGTVVDLRSTPVAGATVDLRTEHVRFEARTDAGGHFEASLPPGNTAIAARDRARASAVEHVELVPGESTSVKLVIVQASVRGLASDGHGPLAGVTITGVVGELGCALTTVTDADGNFELGGVAADVVLTARAPGASRSGPPVAAAPHASRLYVPVAADPR